MKSIKISAVMLAVCCALTLATTVFAHAEISQCSPAVNASVPQPPKEVKCSFTEVLDAAKSKLVVYNASNAQVDNKDAKLDPADKDGKTFIVTLNTTQLSNGLYTVKWTAVAKEDGHEESGEWKFGVGVAVPAPAVLPKTGADSTGLFAALFAASGVALLGISLVLRKFHRTTIIAALLLALSATLLMNGSASAHENRVVGKYRLTVGFLAEPALLNQPNAIDVRVIISDTQQPVLGLDKTVKAEVTSGGKTTPITLRSRFGAPGAYAGDFIPTKAGAYIFRFTGQIEGLTIDEKFESGPGRFSDVTDTAGMMFPEKLIAPQDVTVQLKAAQDAAASAQTMAYIGIGIGILGVLVGTAGFMRRK